MKRTPEELIAEFHRLCDVFDVLEDCAYIGYFDPERFGGYRFGPYPRQRALTCLEEKTATSAQIVSGIREELNHMSLGLLDVLRRDPIRFRTILEAYRSKTGRNYFDDTGSPERLFKTLLRRKRLTNEDECRLLSTFLDDMSFPMTDAERQKGEAMIAAYQPRQRTLRHPHPRTS